MNSEAEFKRFPLHKTQQEEKWLEEKSHEGLHFKRVDDDNYYLFERSWGQPARYKIDIVAEEDHLRFKRSDFAMMEQKMGWEIVSEQGDKIYWRNETTAPVKRYFGMQRFLKEQKKALSKDTLGVILVTIFSVLFFVGFTLFDHIGKNGLTATDIIIACIFAVAIAGTSIYREKKTLLRSYMLARLNHKAQKQGRNVVEAELPELPQTSVKKKILPWKVEEEEKWLEEMAAKGQILVDKVDDAYFFTKDAPQPMQYKIAALPNKITAKESTLKAYKNDEESAGWEKACQSMNRIYWKNIKPIRLEKKYPYMQKYIRDEAYKTAVIILILAASAAALAIWIIIPNLVSFGLTGAGEGWRSLIIPMAGLIGVALTIIMMGKSIRRLFGWVRSGGKMRQKQAASSTI